MISGPIADGWMQITAPHFCAGLQIYAGEVYRTAPILHYMIDWSYSSVYNYCKKKGWKIRWLTS